MEDSLCSIFEFNPRDLLILDSLLTTAGGVLLSFHDVKLIHEFKPCFCVDASLLTNDGKPILSLDDEKFVLWNDGMLPCTCEKSKPYLFVDVSLTDDGEFLSRSKPSIAADGDDESGNGDGCSRSSIHPSSNSCYCRTASGPYHGPINKLMCDE